MTSSFKLALIVGSTAVVSGVAGYLVARQQFNHSMSMTLNGFLYRDAASYAAVDARLLRLIHDNDVPKATSILEDLLDGQLITLSSYHDVVPADQRDLVIYTELARVAPYRTEVPSPNPHPEVQAAVTKALALKPLTGNGR